MLSNLPKAEPKLGGGAFVASELPLSISLSAIGVGGVYLASIAPSPIKQILTVGSMGFVVWGILNLFSGEARAEADPNAPFKAALMEDFNKVTAKINKPAWNEEVGRGLFSGDYDVEILWTNMADRKVSFPYRIYVQEDPQGGIAQEPFKGIALTGVVNLEPKESKIDLLEIDLQHRGLGAALATGVKLTVQKVAPSGQIFDAASTTFYVY
jgi:hypothetical protein